MDKQTAINLAGGQGQLAALLGITTGAISQWSDAVPESRVWQLKALKPKWFSKQTPPSSQSGSSIAATEKEAAQVLHSKFHGVQQ